MNFAQQAKSIESFLLETRRDFHQHPELPMQEFRTSQKVKEFLAAEGIELLPLDTPTSLAAVIRGGKSGRAVALRAELDALPITEECELPFKSVNPGVMHACGHDVHLTCLMGAAKLLKANAVHLAGDVVLLFQAAEENTLGAKQMIAAGVMEHRFDAVFGLHTNTGIPAGDVAFLPGPAQASASLFHIEIKGRGGHGAFPHTTVDPVMIAAQLVTQLQTIVSRNLDPVKTGVLSVCQISAGTSPNIIPETASVAGTIRALEAGTVDLIVERMRAICAGIESAYGCSCVLDAPEGLPPVVNDPALTAMAAASCAAVLGAEHVGTLAPAMVGDDASVFMSLVPGVLGALGVRNEEKGIIHGNHTPRFCVDEACLPVGAACLAQMAWDYLSK